MEEARPSLTQQDTPDGPCAVLAGRWTAAQLSGAGVWRRVSHLLNGLPAQAGSGEAIGWDLQPLQQFDHVAAQLLWNHWGRRWPARLQASADQRAVLERVAQFSAEPLPRARHAALWDEYLRLGAAVLGALGRARDMVQMIGQLLLDTIRLVRAPRRGPWRDLSGHLYAMGATALPITALVGFLIGVVLAYLSAQVLRRFGADTFIVDMLGISLIRELGPVLAAVLIAGRSGSAITAQIGVMRVTEELDAMRVMGIAHGFRLVLPRAFALAVVMPLVSLWTTLAALIGGMLAADATLGITPAYFVEALPRAVEVSNLTLACAKSVVFGLMIALIGCHFGLRVKPDTESLGRGTTASVVVSITTVILVDALFAVVFKNVGL
ncbi:MAG: ABC transporter, permease protein (cluster 9, phospholipid) [Burkholderiaceae bacterium]|jgi:phospholipid/cholesterol/gamma-HCH transport system permease protein|nr:MAG: ABC transporter, permease protein (cluster 9, phospholipid) [Burkholderiaceae bacterium]